MRSQARFRLLVIAAIVAFSLVLSACGAPARAPAAMDAAVSSDSAPAVAYEMAEAAAEMPAGAPLDRKIIGTASIDLVVADTNTAIPAVTQLAAAAGGYVADASFYDRSVGETSMPAGNMTLRVPAAALDDVLAKLEDIPYLEQMTERAWVDVIESGRYSYRTFVGAIDHYLHRFVKRGNNSRLISGVVGLYDPDTKTLQPAITPCNEGHPTRQLQVYDWHRLAHDTSWMANPPPPKPDIPGKKKKTKLHKAVANEIKRFVRRRLKAESR